MKGGILAEALLFVSIFLIKTSTAILYEFSVTNHFDVDEVYVNLIASSSVNGAVAERKVSHGEKLDWSADVLHSSQDMNFECSVCIGHGDYEIILDSFVAFDFAWIGSSWNLPGFTVNKFEWIVDELGSFRISHSPEIKHSWNYVILVFFVMNRFSSHEDLILSIPTTQGKVPSQHVVPHGKKLAGAQKLQANDQRHIEIKCSVRGLVGNSRAYGDFKVFDSSWFSETNAMMGIRKFEWIVRERRATMVYPEHHDQEYH